MPRKAFYAWQSDSDHSTNWHFIAEALKQSIARLNADLEIEESEAELAFDRDTHGEPGMPAVADTVLRKISEAAVFIADLTFVAKIDKESKPKYLPNANVSIELGFAAGTIGFDRILCVFNDHYGDPDDLPFDLVHRRHPIRYLCSAIIRRGCLSVNRTTRESAVCHDCVMLRLAKILIQLFADMLCLCGLAFRYAVRGKRILGGLHHEYSLALAYT
jgi:hypothetical protein